MLIVDNKLDAELSSNGNRPLMCRGIRGAITVNHDNPAEILEATRELMETIVRLNDINPNNVASVYLTTTTDLTATYPALAVRQMGWLDVALLCGHEMAVPDGLPRCIRALIHWNTTKTAHEIAHVYMREAIVLRPDLKNRPSIRPIQMTPMDAAFKMLLADIS
ncbi:MAG: chorismate mutase [Anaerolineae bacterium]